MQLHIHTHWSD